MLPALFVLLTAPSPPYFPFSPLLDSLVMFLRILTNLTFVEPTPPSKSVWSFIFVSDSTSLVFRSALRRKIRSHVQKHLSVFSFVPTLSPLLPIPLDDS